jgi:O-antigen ligase
MTPIATVVYLIGIVGLFVLDRDRNARTSKALWLPIVWLLINGSRPITEWLQMGSPSAIDESVEGSPVDRAFYFGLIALGLFVVSRRWPAILRFLRANPWIVVFAFYCLVSAIWSDYPDVSVKRWIKSVGDYVMVLIVLTEAQRLNAMRRVFTVASFVLVPLSVLLIKYYPNMSRYYNPWEGTMYVSGVAVDKNMLGMTCLVCGLGTWWLLIEAWQDREAPRRKLRLLAHATVLGMTLWLFHMANSMTSLSCFLMSGSVMTAVTLVRFARKPVIVHALVLLVASFAASVLFLNIGGGALESMGRNSTLTGRTEIWSGLLKISDSPLLGSGFQSFWVGDRLRMIWGVNGFLYGVNEAHNAYLETFLNLGWVGVAILVALIIAGYRNVIRTLRQDRGVGAFGLGIFVASIIYGYTEASGFGMMSPMWFAFLLLTIAVPRVYRPEIEASNLPPIKFPDEAPSDRWALSVR